MPGSFFQRDRLVEQEIGDFLDLYFYKTEVSNFKRYNDKKDQNHGIDVSFAHRGSEILVDEKSNSSPFYINKFIPTFAFEIKNTTSGKIGWLIDSTKKTDYYLMIYVFAEQPWKVPVVVKKLHCFLLKRESLLNHLKSKGVTPESLIEKCDESIEKKLEKHIEKTPDGDYYYYLTPNLAEKPFNIVIRRKLYSKLAELEFEVDKEKVTYLKK